MAGLKKIFSCIKRQAAAVIAVTAAAVSCLFVPVTDYTKYIDTDIISLLFSLMAVSAGLRRNNVFGKLSCAVVSGAGNTRRMAAALVLSVFFASMLITNDVALIVFVPFTLMIYEQIKLSPLYVIVLQTVAANMGSALTPFGNPQNLYLFSQSGMSAGDFFSITARLTIAGLAILIICLILVKREPVPAVQKKQVRLDNPKAVFLYAVLFLLCILSVFGLTDNIMIFAAVCTVVAIMEPRIFLDVDYGLLVTFAAFFIFVGNIKNIPQISSFMESIIAGREFETALILSQIISNVPAAIMLSGFTDNYKALIMGTDLGGLGTLIASMASLISFQSYTRAKGGSGRYILVFTGVNLLFLALLYPAARFFL